MKITLHGTTVHRDGLPVGILTPDRTFQPTIRLQSRTIEKITAILSTLRATPESEPDGQISQKTPAPDEDAQEQPNLGAAPVEAPSNQDAPKTPAPGEDAQKTPDPGAQETPAPDEAASLPDAQERADPEPEMLSEAGDKTPAYIEWYRRNHSAEAFRAKYAHRKIL